MIRKIKNIVHAVPVYGVHMQTVRAELYALPGKLYVLLKTQKFYAYDFLSLDICHRKNTQLKMQFNFEGKLKNLPILNTSHMYK